MLKSFRFLLSLLPMCLFTACDSGDMPPPPKTAEELAYISDESPVSKAALDKAIEPLFKNEELGETNALLILYQGEPLVEEYGEGFDDDTRFLSWSMAKSMTAALLGFLVADGRLVLDDPAPVDVWQRAGDARAGITLRHLLHMTSGLDHEEDGASEGRTIYDADTNRMLFLDGAQDMAAFAEHRPPEAAPGTQFEYSTATSLILADIITRQLTDSDDPEIRQTEARRFIRGRLLEPLGMDDTLFEFDAHGTFIGGSMVWATARDYGTFGEFLRHKGAKAGAQHLPVGWVDFMRTPSELDPSYGGHIWLNRPRPDGRTPVLFPGYGPESIFAAVGHLGQFIIVSPDQQLTVVRLGHTDNEQRSALAAQMGQIFAIFPVKE